MSDDARNYRNLMGALKLGAALLVLSLAAIGAFAVLAIVLRANGLI